MLKAAAQISNTTCCGRRIPWITTWELRAALRWRKLKDHTLAAQTVLKHAEATFPASDYELLSFVNPVRARAPLTRFLAPTAARYD